ncbi:MAG: sulfotransferase [Candidatus Sedimenticola sp. PURPLELP]
MTTYCLICSAARSGSTIFDMLLGGHPDATSLGEFSFLGKALALDQQCTCGQLVRDCSAWKRVFDRVALERGDDLRDNPYSYRQWDTRASVIIDECQQTLRYIATAKLRALRCDLRYFLNKHKVLRPRLPSVLASGVENTAYLYEIIAQEWNKKIIVDSSKNIHKALALYEAFPDKVKIVYLTRDGRGVFFSRRSSGFSRKESLKGWRRYNIRALNLLERNISTESLFQLKYEELSSEPEESLKEICRFLSIPFDRKMTDLKKGERHMVNGNDTRFKSNQKICLDERWRESLSGDDLDYFYANGRSLNQKLNYQI